MKRICVFAGSSRGLGPEYVNAAKSLGRELASRELGLVYGGAKVGLMGVLADTVLEAGRDVIGVMPTALVEKEVAHHGLSDLRVVGSMQERKALMIDLSDGFIAAPGGLGTLEEIFEVLTLAQLGMHEKPCGLLNVCGYYGALLRFLDHSVNERFIQELHREMIVVEESPQALLDRFDHYQPARVSKWVD